MDASGIAASWTDLLAQSPSSPGDSSRVALSEAAALCLALEAPKCYAVYRPSNSGSGIHRYTSPAPALATPQHFLQLLARLREALSTSAEAARIAEVLVDLLNKPPHPHQPGPWDLTQNEVRAVKATAIQHVMDSMQGGGDALAWITRLLRLTDTCVGEGEVTESEVPLLSTALSERYGLHGGSPTHRVHCGDADGEWLLTCSPVVLAAIAAAMLRSTTKGMKAHALELLEAAALTRLSWTSLSSGKAVAGSYYRSDMQRGAPKALFDETVAVRCAEAAAVQGDAETVTRLIFLLYRARGALGFATLAEHRQRRRSGRGGEGTWRRTSSGLLPRTSSWFSARWSCRDDGAMAKRPALVEDDAADMRFELAVVRLLKSAMQALLYHPQRMSDPVVCTVEEALSLWDGLRGAISWPGIAAIGAELLRYLADQHARLSVAADAGNGGAASDDVHVRRAALQVYGHLCRAAPVRQRTAAQRDELNHFTSLMLRIFSAELAVIGSAGMLVPVAASITAAERILRLFANLSGPRAQEVALPYALAASLAIFAAAATQKGYSVPPSLLAPLAAYFSETQSLHYYCVAAASAEVPAHVAVSGSLVLLHLLLWSSVPEGEWARGDGELWPLLQRMQKVNETGQGADTVAAAPATAAAYRVTAWLRVSGDQQRSLLWLLLLSAKQRDTSWCSAVVNVFSSPASSTVVNCAVSSVYAQLPQAELKSVVELLYACGNNDNPTQASQTLDRVVSASLQLPIRALTLQTLDAQLQKFSAGRQATSVLVLGAASIRALAERCATTLKKDADDELTVEGFLRVLQPLLVGPTAALPLRFTVVVLTPASLVELQRMYTGADDAPRHASAFVRTMHDALVSRATPSAYQVRAASSWPLLPSLALALRKQKELQSVDGLREATAAARHLEHTLPKESRPLVCLWVERETLFDSPHALSAKAEVLRHYGVREVSTHRAHVEKAKRDIFSLVRSGAAGTVHPAGAQVAGEAALTEAKAARRTRHHSLLSAVSERSRRQRSA
ncbi:hypothetical protein LMJF_36_2740 [Leishmania major strain Friedlin]|uniref:Uncharacterized protein n=1 Tax=Leishmania major TaxID=5664 RepID=Q4Q1E6_LEIMA|nr:hypothetical protein LMJF_36_2740 [Leishmania major strain Friedlin]CAG9583808.1 hypothetical_protein_-_conserved [Leishmania major strain Friedlin]CAJ09233.1 hypothetical protein LMJF_36_2740 [Leishmania major strain Friedlin]|eukprot:XP_001686852.1 hypothetical protein LMJF_36_2740 [Leishmania major strain Friedlin]